MKYLPRVLRPQHFRFRYSHDSCDCISLRATPRERIGPLPPGACAVASRLYGQGEFSSERIFVLHGSSISDLNNRFGRGRLANISALASARWLCVLAFQPQLFDTGNQGRRFHPHKLRRAIGTLNLPASFIQDGSQILTLAPLDFRFGQKSRL
jgi:hypothetical protein